MEPADSKDAVRDQSSRIHYYGESLAYSADGKLLILAVEKRVKETTETAIGFYDADTGKSLRTIPTQWNFLATLVPTGDGRLIAAGTVGSDDNDDPSGSVQVFDMNSGTVQKTYPVVASSISPDGRWMASTDEMGPSGPRAILWSLGDGKQAHELLETANLRVMELAARSPGEYFVFSQELQEIVSSTPPRVFALAV